MSRSWSISELATQIVTQTQRRMLGGVIEEEATFSSFATVQTSWLQDAELQDEDTG